MVTGMIGISCECLQCLALTVTMDELAVMTSIDCPLQNAQKLCKALHQKHKS